MGVLDFLKNIRNKGEDNHFTCKAEIDGLAITADRSLMANAAEISRKNLWFGAQYTCMKQFEEQGLAERFPNGWVVSTGAYWQVAEEMAELFDLPASFTGSLMTDITGTTTQSAFSVKADVILNGETISHYDVQGPVLKLTEAETYSLNKGQWRALHAIQAHGALSAQEKTEYTNNLLIFELQQAQQEGLKIDLAHFKDVELVKPDTTGVTANEQASGDVILTPNYGVNMDSNEFAKRIHQLKGDGDKILRVGKKFILLDEERLKATQEILANHKIPKAQVSRFFESPSAYLDAALVDLENGFSLRVNGAAPMVHGYFGDTEKSGIEWFSQLIQNEKKVTLTQIIEGADNFEGVERTVMAAINKGAEVAVIEEGIIDTSEPQQVKAELAKIKQGIDSGTYKPEGGGNTEDDVSEENENERLETAVVDIKGNDDEDDFASDAADVSDVDVQKFNFAQGNLKREPYEHQSHGIKWLMAHAAKGINNPEGAGALLADDMGLGKTFMVLVAIAEYFKQVEKQQATDKPILIVAPLSLLENWKAEIDETFKQSPFQDVVILQSGADLKRYKIQGAKGETKQVLSDDGFSGIRYSLKLGKDYGIDRLDMPKRLVLTTYQTLRDYQFSLCSIDWGVVAFDEAQNIKNPNALQTRAAKGLKADFRLLATGTPVENTLKDIWCLFDMAIPGLLGSWKQFHGEYITPINTAGKESYEAELEQKQFMGEQLRKRIGNFMLRRVKEGNLTGLPSKSIWLGVDEPGIGAYDARLQSQMAGPQLQSYDSIVHEVQNAPEGSGQAFVLPSLGKLREISIHHNIDQIVKAENSKNIESIARESSKMTSVLAILDDIKKRQQKVIIFITNKALQRALCVLLQAQYAIEIDIVNGDTKAVSNKKDVLTRKGIIDKFQTQAGFGIIIMSPVAAGVGLTVTGANNVIHLERHWNPAKEAQATDRVYRIGQKNAVNIYIPIAVHPEMASFDVLLNRLLSKKVDLSQSIMATNLVKKEEMMGVFG